MRRWNEAGTCQWDIYGGVIVVHGDEVVLTAADLIAMLQELGHTYRPPRPDLEAEALGEQLREAERARLIESTKARLRGR